MGSHTTGICPQCGGAEVCLREVFRVIEEDIEELEDEIEECGECSGVLTCDTHTGLLGSCREIKRRMGDLYGQSESASTSTDGGSD